MGPEPGTASMGMPSSRASFLAAGTARTLSALDPSLGFSSARKGFLTATCVGSGRKRERSSFSFSGRPGSTMERSSTAWTGGGSFTLSTASPGSARRAMGAWTFTTSPSLASFFRSTPS